MVKNKKIAAKKKNLPGDICLDMESHLLGEILHTHQALIQIFSREVGIPLARLALLHELLHAVQDGVCMSDIALRMGVTPALVTRQVQEMERECWINRRPDRKDKRRCFIHLTAKGRKLVLVLHARAHVFESSLLQDVNHEDLKVAVRVLIALRGKLEERRKNFGKNFEGLSAESKNGFQPEKRS